MGTADNIYQLSIDYYSPYSRYLQSSLSLRYCQSYFVEFANIRSLEFFLRPYAPYST